MPAALTRTSARFPEPPRRRRATSTAADGAMPAGLDVAAHADAAQLAAPLRLLPALLETGIVGAACIAASSEVS